MGNLLEQLSANLQDRVTEDNTVFFQKGSQPLLENIDAADRQLPAQGLLDTSIFLSRSRTIATFRFCVLLREYIIQHVHQRTATHKFLQSLDRSNKLQRCYTQNIDGLEMYAGLQFVPSGSTLLTDEDPPKCVQLHGNLATVRCRLERCKAVTEWTPESTMAFYAGQVPPCVQCEQYSRVRQRRGFRQGAVGDVRPNIVLYGEEGPDAQLIGQIQALDMSCKLDMLLIVGTSLKTDGARQMARDMARVVHKSKNGTVVYVGLHAPSRSEWSGVIDYCIQSDCDEWSREAISKLPDNLVGGPRHKREKVVLDMSQPPPPLGIIA